MGATNIDECKISELKETIKEVQNVLESNDEWLERYKGYAEAISTNKNSIKINSKNFHEWTPLNFYLSISKGKIAKKTLTLDLRYRGQNVATLKSNKTGITISTKNQKNNNERDFRCTIELNDVAWRSEEAKKFRQFFSEGPKRLTTTDNKGNEEHNIESLIVTEIAKSSSVDKQILGIQPVDFENFRISMKTPISASKKNKLKYSKQSGGSIDILARSGQGKGTYLTVIEVKDENNKKEPPLTALKQAIRYAVFIRELLRSEIGNDWYKLFGFNKDVPEKLRIRVACAMPDNDPDKSFAKKELLIENDILECHYIYFKYDKENNQLTDFQTSLNK